MQIIKKWQAKSKDHKYQTNLIKKIERLPKSKIQKAEDIHQEVFKQVDCLDCANCCKSIPPIVSKRDTKRIAKSLNMTVDKFTESYLTIDTDGDRVINASPCPFLESDNKCKIYEDRPSACRQYPHSGDNSFYKHINLHKTNAQYCPALLEILVRLAQVK